MRSMRCCSEVREDELGFRGVEKGDNVNDGVGQVVL